MICIICKQDKSKNEFAENRKKCRKCRSIENRDRLRTFDGIVDRIYSSQRTHSKERGHPMPSYTKEELRTFLHSSKKFKKLYNKWVESGYEKQMKPSVDRIDNNIGYSFDNITVMTWQENKDKGHSDSKTTRLSTGKDKRPVRQLTKDNKTVATYISLREASRRTNIGFSLISDVVRGRPHHITAGGYKWEYI